MISCSIFDQYYEHALWDLGASVNIMPMVIYEKLLYPALSPTYTLCTAYYSSHMYLWKIGTYLRFWKMGRICFSSLGLERLLDWTTFTGMFPATYSGSQLGFLQEFSKEVQVSQWYSRVAQSVWSSHMVEKYDHLLPISKADMWSLWVGKCMHTLVTCIA